MTRSLTPRVEALFWALLTALGYFLLAAFALQATKGANNIAAIWPPSGYFLALLLLMPARARPASFAGAAVASIAANALGGAPWSMAVVFTLANACEAGLALWLIRRRKPADLSFMVPRSVVYFCFAALAASVVSACIATFFTGADGNFFLSWLTTVALGMLIVAPPIVMLARLIGSGAMDNLPRRRLIEAAAILAGATAITGASFAQADFPLTFLPYVAVIAAAYRLGPFGAAAGMLIVAIVSAWLTGRGMGPIAAIGTDQRTEVFFLQFYLVTLLFSALPLAALLVVQKRLARRLEQSNRWLLQAEAAALVGHWRVDLARWTIQWSDQAYRIHGIEPDTPMSVESSLDCYMPGDGARLRATLEDAARKGAPFEFHGQIICLDDEVRDIVSHGSIETSRSGRAVGIFGTIQDVTATVENARILEAARNTAEQAANTDLLTGLPNRRHTLVCLARALVRARDENASLAVAIFDIDHFKRINDSHGHAIGDEVIRRVAERARVSLREEDMVGRFGGEEFVCIFQGPSARAAELMAERVRKAIEAQDGAAGEPPKVTISIGLAVYGGEAGIEDLLHRADKALYLAKREGRNRLRMAA